MHLLQRPSLSYIYLHSLFGLKYWYLFINNNDTSNDKLYVTLKSEWLYNNIIWFLKNTTMCVFCVLFIAWKYMMLSYSIFAFLKHETRMLFLTLSVVSLYLSADDLYPLNVLFLQKMIFSSISTCEPRGVFSSVLQMRY